VVDLAQFTISIMLKFNIVSGALASSSGPVPKPVSLGERLELGVTYLVPGLLVVMGLLALLALCVEFMVWMENKRNERVKAQEEMAAVPKAGQEAAPVSEGAEDFSTEITAAIGLALHQHLSSQRLAMGIGAGSSQSGFVSWASSGRIEIMNARQRVTSRGKQQGIK